MYTSEYFATQERGQVTGLSVWGLMLSLGVALHRTKPICSRIYRNTATKAKTRHKLWEKIPGQLKLL